MMSFPQSQISGQSDSGSETELDFDSESSIDIIPPTPSPKKKFLFKKSDIESSKRVFINYYILLFK